MYIYIYIYIYIYTYRPRRGPRRPPEGGSGKKVALRVTREKGAPRRNSSVGAPSSFPDPPFGRGTADAWSSAAASGPAGLLHSAKGGAVEAGCSDLYDITYQFTIQIPPQSTAPPIHCTPLCRVSRPPPLWPPQNVANYFGQLYYSTFFLLVYKCCWR